MADIDLGNLAVLAVAAKDGWDYFGIDGVADNHARFCLAADPHTVLQLLGQILALEDTQQRHLRLIVNLSKESISTDEAIELRAQIASLISEVGTLKSRLNQAQKMRQL